MKKATRICLLWMAVLFVPVMVSGCKTAPQDTIRIGFFPNLTHSQAVYGYANGDFERAFGKGTTVKWLSFNAGPSEIEAMFAGEVDIGYIGPTPAINGYEKSGGDLKIIAGATLNGALLVTREDLKLDSVNSLEGRVIAVPQFGNTQHLCLLNILSNNGIKTVENGGTTQIIESSNPDIKTLMDKGDIDAALVPEPWATRLVEEIHANILLDSDHVWDSGDSCTALIIVDRKFYEQHRDQVAVFLRTHLEITNAINENPEQAMVKINDKIGELTGSKLDETVLVKSFSNLVVTVDPGVSSIDTYMTIFENEGILSGIKDRDNIYDFSVLNGILKEKSLPEIGGAR